MILAHAHFPHGAEHAVGGFASYDAGLEIETRAGNAAARGREDALHAGARVGRAANHLHVLAARIHQTEAQSVGIGMGLGLHHIAHDEMLEILGPVGDAFDLEAERDQAPGDLGRVGRGVEMLFQPGEGEFHRPIPPTGFGMSSGTKP